MLECYRIPIYVITKNRKSYYDFWKHTVNLDVTEFKYVYLEKASQLQRKTGWDNPYVRLLDDCNERPDWKEIVEKLREVRAITRKPD